MNQIGAKIYYLISTGEGLTITSEMQGNVEETTKEQDMQSHEQLKDKNIDEVDYIELEYGTLAQTFANIKSYSVDVDTRTFKGIYYTQEELNLIKSKQESQKNIFDRINMISEYVNLDNNSISELENTIINYEQNKILNEVI